MNQTRVKRMQAPGPKKILACDGGGIRGLMSVEILAKLEDDLRVKLGRGSDFVLADYFDFVCGTSTGEVISPAPPRRPTFRPRSSRSARAATTRSTDECRRSRLGHGLPHARRLPLRRADRSRIRRDGRRAGQAGQLQRPEALCHVRYDPDLSADGLRALGIRDVDPKKIQELDSVKSMGDMQRVAKGYAQQRMRIEHLRGFV